MDMFLNYILIGIIFSFIVEHLLDKWSYHPKLQDKNFGWNERIIAILFWPIGLTVFIVQFIKERFE